MNKIDFAAFNGGFRLDGETMDFLQAAHADVLNLLYADAPAGVPVIIAGMVGSTAGSSFSLTAGVFYYNGELYSFAAQTVNLSGGGTYANVVASNNVSALSFFDGFAHDVIHTRVGVLTNAASGGVDLPFSTFKIYAQYAGAKAKTTFLHQNSSGLTSAGAAVDIYYKKNLHANTLHIHGAASVADAQLLGAGINHINALTLPAAYRPVSRRADFAILLNTNVLIPEAGATSFIHSIQGRVLTTGVVELTFIKPDVTVASYAGEFNAIIPLD